MGKLKPKQIDKLVEDAAQALQAKWPAIRAQATSEYAKHGRGAFVVNLEMFGDQVYCAECPFPFLGLSGTLHDEDDELRQIMHRRGVEYYNPERQVAFLLMYQNLDGTPWVHMEILSEYPDGTPRPTKAALKKRWCGFNRTCPKCHHAFIGLADSWPCSQCGHRFWASEAAYQSLARKAIEPIAKYVEPVTPPHDFDELYSRLGELVIRGGKGALPDAERLIWYALEMHGEIFNGGFNQYFCNSSGDHAQELLQLFKSHGLAAPAGILETACAVFPDGGPSKEHVLRQDQFSEDLEADLEELTSKYYSVYPDFDALHQSLWQFWQSTKSQGSSWSLSDTIMRLVSSILRPKN